MTKSSRMQKFGLSAGQGKAASSGKGATSATGVVLSGNSTRLWHMKREYSQQSRVYHCEPVSVECILKQQCTPIENNEIKRKLMMISENVIVIHELVSDISSMMKQHGFT